MLKSVLTRLAAACAILAFAATALFAQTTLDSDAYENWENLASRAEWVIANDSSTDRALETLREDLADWRDRFSDGQSVNEERIATVRAQLATLGDPPAEGEDPESEEIAARRETLNQTLSELVAPVTRAEEAYIRADGLIGEIDSELRSRTSSQLFSTSFSPLNPENWTTAFQSLEGSIVSLSSELTDQGGTTATWQTQISRLPIVLPLVLIALVLLTRSRAWVDFVADRLRGNLRSGTGVFRLLASLLMILLPYLGVVAFCEALKQSGLLGYRTQTLVEFIPQLALVLLYIRWLAEMAFHRDPDQAILPLPESYRRQGRYHAVFIAAIFVLRGFLDWLGEFDNYSDEAIVTLQFPLLVIAGLQLFLLGRIRHALGDGTGEGEDPEETDADDSPPLEYRLQLTHIAARIVSFCGIAGPVIAAFGYFALGSLLVFSTISTIAVVATVYIGQQAISMLYDVVTRKKPDDDSQSLIPVILGILLALAAVPVVALLWGARRSDLSEIWSRFREGFQIGDTVISPTDFLTVAIVFAIGFVATRLVQGTLRNSVLPRTKMDVGGRNAILSGTGYLGIVLAAVIAISAGGLDLSSLALVAGALSVGIGFGLQNIIQNFVSGIILLIERPISEGDWIEVGGVHGTVRDISVRSTRIQTFDRTDVIVPNGDFISGTVTNYTRGNVLGRIIVNVGVSYGTDTRKVEKILLDIGRQHPTVLMNPGPQVVFSGFGADSMDFELRLILVDVTQGLAVRTEVNHQIAERFAEEGIEIPFAQRDIWLRNPELLADAIQPDPADESRQGGRDIPAPAPAEGAIREIDTGSAADDSDLDTPR